MSVMFKNFAVELSEINSRPDGGNMALRVVRIHIILLALFTVVSAHAETTAAKVLREGRLTCGVSNGLLGFGYQDNDNRWHGLTVDFCRAVAAAILGDGNAVKFVPLSASARLPALLSGQVDLLAHTVSVSLSREAAIGVVFPGVYFLDGTQVLAAKALQAKRLEDLHGSTVCIERKTTAAAVLAEIFEYRKVTYTPLPFESLPDVQQALFGGRCQALAAVQSKLRAILAAAPDDKAKQFEILPEYFSKQTLGPVVRRGDEEWAALVRWVLYALIEAEELDINGEQAAKASDTACNPRVKNLLLESGALGKDLGLRSDWALKAIAAAGNYGEIYERNFGQASALKMERGYNRLWKHGGLLYAPPFD